MGASATTGDGVGTDERRGQAGTRAIRRAQETAQQLFSGYAEEYTPLAGYAALLAAFGGAFGALLVMADRSGRIPRRLGGADILLVGIATHKLTRIVTKDWVTAPIRAPFVHYEKSLGGGEVAEKARGSGLRRAMGDLLTCPWCSGPWVASTLFAAFVVRPRTTRLVASTFAAVAISDFLHHAYAAAKKLAE